jgi:cilia- and flagella-associated protein 57
MKATFAQFQSNMLQIMKNPGQMAPTAKKLNAFLDVDVEKESSRSTSVSNSARETSNYNYSMEGDDINEELHKQGRWMNRKLWLIDETNKKLKEIREENVDQILNQNTKLIEECNILRAENERHKKLTRNVQKMLMEAKRMRNKKANKKPNLNKLVQKYEENTIQLKS